MQGPATRAVRKVDIPMVNACSTAPASAPTSLHHYTQLHHFPTCTSTQPQVSILILQGRPTQSLTLSTLRTTGAMPSSSEPNSSVNDIEPAERRVASKAPSPTQSQEDSTPTNAPVHPSAPPPQGDDPPDAVRIILALLKTSLSTSLFYLSRPKGAAARKTYPFRWNHQT